MMALCHGRGVTIEVFTLVAGEQWKKRGAYAWLMFPLSILYCVVMSLRREAYESGLLKSHQIKLPVFVVGNLSVGGTGKTPLVIWIANKIAENGLRPAVISRGYGGRAKEFPFVVYPNTLRWQGKRVPLCGLPEYSSSPGGR
jgi:tetraacyldisaccharide-1-P 4'-kinase